VGDEILEVNGKSLEDATHTEVISHIHQVRDGPRSSPRTRPTSCEMYSSEDFTVYGAQWGQCHYLDVVHNGTDSILVRVRLNPRIKFFEDF
jgi:hypothetical protein